MAEQQPECQRPACGGRYEDFGGDELYCDVCGLAPSVSPDGTVGSPPTGAIARRGAGSAGAGPESDGGSAG
ncbi:hypothetical protein, partial [Streptomyces sparsus]